MKTLFLSFTLSILLGLTAHAGLKWEQTQVELHPKPGDKEAIGHFKYKNEGPKPVRITSVKTSCGCTVAQSQKNDIPPGETGEITATFHIGGRTGTQVKSINVETDDPYHPSLALILKAVIEQSIAIQPSFVFWRVGDAPDAKSVTVTMPKEIGAKLKLSPSSENFQARLQDLGEGEFKIDIQPRDTSREVFGTIAVRPDNSPSSNPIYITARVMKGSASSVSQ